MAGGHFPRAAKATAGWIRQLDALYQAQREATSDDARNELLTEINKNNVQHHKSVEDVEVRVGFLRIIFIVVK